MVLRLRVGQSFLFAGFAEGHRAHGAEVSIPYNRRQIAFSTGYVLVDPLAAVGESRRRLRADVTTDAKEVVVPGVLVSVGQGGVDLVVKVHAGCAQVVVRAGGAPVPHSHQGTIFHTAVAVDPCVLGDLHAVETEPTRALVKHPRGRWWWDWLCTLEGGSARCNIHHKSGLTNWGRFERTLRPLVEVYAFRFSALERISITSTRRIVQHS